MNIKARRTAKGHFGASDEKTAATNVSHNEIDF